jgi:predicted Zn-dependent peptidase
MQEAVASAAQQERPSSDGMSAEELDNALSRLADMKDRGLITQAEFDQKKSELLDRLR